PRLVVSQDITSSLEPKVLQVGVSGLIDSLDRGCWSNFSKGKELFFGFRHIFSARTSVVSESGLVRIWLLLNVGSPLKFGCLPHSSAARTRAGSESGLVRSWLLLNVGSPLKFGCLPNMIRLGDFFAVSRLVVKRIRVLTLASSLALVRMYRTTGSILSFE